MIYYIDRIINKIILILTIIFVFLGLYSLYDSYPIYDEIKNTEKVKIYNPIISDEYINKNIIGWIKIVNTIIDYPILQGKDNNTYLSLNYKDEYSFSGSIFLDYRNNSDFSDDMNIIYGHNMSYKIMFSELKYYKDKKYFKTHNKGKLYIKDNTYDINILLYKEVNENDDIPYNLYLYRNNYNKKIYKTLMNKKGNINKILILSTCKKGNKNKRIILVCELNKIEV